MSEQGQISVDLIRIQVHVVLVAQIHHLLHLFPRPHASRRVMRIAEDQHFHALLHFFFHVVKIQEIAVVPMDQRRLHQRPPRISHDGIERIIDGSVDHNGIPRLREGQNGKIQGSDHTVGGAYPLRLHVQAVFSLIPSGH